MASDGRLIDANTAFAALAGRDRSVLLRLRFQDLLSRGGLFFYETHFVPTLLMRGSLQEIAFDLLRPDGGTAPIFLNAVLRRSDVGQPSHVLLAAFDATQRRLYEAELLRARKESEQIAEVVRRSSDAIIRLTPAGLIQTWNNGAQQIFGTPALEAIGRPLVSFFIESGRPTIEARIRNLHTGIDALEETTALHPSGRTLDVSVSLTPHLEAPGTLVAFSAIIRDITARKLAARALLQSEKLASVGRLASSIAHEINNPLESVTNLLYILQSRVDDDETRSLVITAQEELARVSHIATHTLRFHKQSSGRTQVDLHALMQSVFGLYRGRLQSSHITVITEVPADIRLTCYEGELRQILVNLVSNAFDAMRSGGTLRLRCRTTVFEGRSHLRISIADTGTGIDPSMLEHIFEPFFSTKGAAGTGLGLWITKDLVAKNGGSISLRSTTQPGRSGTVVTMSFPTEPRST